MRIKFLTPDPRQLRHCVKFFASQAPGDDSVSPHPGCKLRTTQLTRCLINAPAALQPRSSQPSFRSRLCHWPQAGILQDLSSPRTPSHPNNSVPISVTPALRPPTCINDRPRFLPTCPRHRPRFLHTFNSSRPRSHLAALNSDRDSLPAQLAEPRSSDPGR